MFFLTPLGFLIFQVCLHNNAVLKADRKSPLLRYVYVRNYVYISYGACPQEASEEIPLKIKFFKENCLNCTICKEIFEVTSLQKDVSMEVQLPDVLLTHGGIHENCITF